MQLVDFGRKLTADGVKKRHAFLSPSSAARWSRCPASPYMESSCGPEPDSDGAITADGTRAHDLSARMLRCRIQGEPFDDTPLLYPEDMWDAAASYVDFVSSLPVDYALIECEFWLPAPFGDDGDVCTPDFVGIERDGRDDILHIVDFKFGYIPVLAEHNPQLAIYAHSVINGMPTLFDEPLNFVAADLCIYQPHVSKTEKRWSMPIRRDAGSVDIEDLAAAARTCRALASLPADDRVCHPSIEACRYCRARAFCRQRAIEAMHHVSHILEITQEGRDVRSGKVTPEFISQLYSHIPEIKALLDDVSKHVFDTMMAGGTIPGYKLVKGRSGNRKWTSTADVVEAVIKDGTLHEDDIFEKSLMSPTSFEKLAKAGIIDDDLWDVLKSKITRAEGKPVVAPVDDKREEYRRDDMAFPDETKKEEE